MKREHIILAGVIVITLGLSTLPYGVAWLAQPPDQHFMGIVSNVPDTAQYLAWMKASTRQIIIENPLTPEPQAAPTFFNLQWLVLGRLSGWFGVSPAWTLQLFRIFAVVLFMVVTYKLCKVYFPTESWAAWAAWLCINFSAGWGWVLVLIKQLTHAADVKYPLTVYVAEPVSFQNMMIYPHFLLAATLLILIFGAFVIAVDRQQLKYGLVSGLLGLILGLTHAYDLSIVYGVLGIFTLLVLLRNGFSWRPILSLFTVGLISSPPAAYFYYLTTTDPLWREVLAQFKNVAVFTPDPLLLIILMGLPLVLAVFTLDGVFPLPAKNLWQLLIRVWFGVNFFLLYIPTDFQIHMLNGWQVALGLLASEGLFYRLLPAIGRHAAFKQAIYKIAPRWQPKAFKWLLVAALLLAVVPTNIYLLLWRIKDMSSVQHQYYLYNDELAALKWLETNTSPQDLVFADLTVGQYIPGLAGNKVYLGHWAQTVDFYTKKARVAYFYRPELSEQDRRAILEQYHVKYLFYGREEKSMGTVNPGQLPYLTLVFDTPNTKIYQTNF